MSEKEEIAFISDYKEVEKNTEISKILANFTQEIREMLVFDEDGGFEGYLTKRELLKRRNLPPETKVERLVKNVPIIKYNASNTEIAQALLSGRINSVPVEKDDEIIGVVHDIDLLNAAKDIFSDKKVKEIMTKDPFVVKNTHTVAQYIALCRNQNIARVPVVDNTFKLVGIISPHDVSQFIVRQMVSESVGTRETQPAGSQAADFGETVGERAGTKYQVLKIAVEDVMTTSVTTCKEDDSLIESIDTMIANNHKTLIVIDDDQHPIGILTTTDLLEEISVPIEDKGYYVRIIGDLNNQQVQDAFEEGKLLINKYGEIIGDLGQLIMHFKVFPRRKFRGKRLYQVKIRIYSTSSGISHVAKAEGFGPFAAMQLAKDKIEREIISEQEEYLDFRDKRKTEHMMAIFDDLGEFEEL